MKIFLKIGKNVELYKIAAVRAGFKGITELIREREPEPEKRLDDVAQCTSLSFQQ